MFTSFGVLFKISPVISLIGVIEKVIEIIANKILNSGSIITQFGFKYKTILAITTPIDYTMSPIICARAALIF